jgi:hypothetical protein
MHRANLLGEATRGTAGVFSRIAMFVFVVVAGLFMALIVSGLVANALS